MPLLSRQGSVIFKFKAHTRWKGLLVQLGTSMNKSLGLKKENKSILVLSLLVTLLFLTQVVLGGPAKLILYQGAKKLEISSRQCRAGIYMKNSTTFTCACVTGVWGFYHDYCQKPISIVGGDSYCFRMKNHSISQVVSFGSLKYPFEASLSIFQKGFSRMTESHTDENTTLSESTSSFLTITDTSWTVYGGSEEEALCLKATVSGTRKFCLFGEEVHRKPIQWTSITKVQKGCFSKNIRRADTCSDILPPNDYADCSIDLLDDLMTEPSNDISIDTSSTTEEPSGWIPIKKIDIPDDENPSGLSSGWIPIKKINVPDDENTSDLSSGWIPIKKINVPDNTTTSTLSDEFRGWIPIKRINVTDDGDTSEEPSGWIPIKQVEIPDNTSAISGESSEWIPIKRITTDDDASSTQDPTEGWIPIKHIKMTGEGDSHLPDSSEVSTTESSTPETSFENLHPGWIKIKSNKKSESTELSTTPGSSSSEEWIPIYRFTTTAEPETSTLNSNSEEELTTTRPKDPCDSDLTREKVKEYWLDPANNECSKSINEAVFTDQLRRFTVRQFDKIFDSRVKSLAQMEQMLNYTKLIMQKTCGEDYVPADFFQVAFSAFLMFINEDFFYGVEGATPDVYPRILKTLKGCLEKAEPFVFETDSLECGMKKINGWLILPGKREKIEIPERSRWTSFEPLIETTWKMFLNTHSLCFPDFKYSNDHHHFSVLIMELFSKSIYEKWIEPLESRELYSFILPNFNFLNETMENIDYCVGATNRISTCPAWMTRSGVPTPARRKRSIWVDKVAQDKKRSEVWDGEAFCLQKMEDPQTRLGLEECHS